MASFTPDIARSQRMTLQERKAILDRLDAADAENPAKNRRAMARVPYRTELACRIFHPGGSMTTSNIATRNLSAGGTSFLYQGFLHKNTKVELILIRRHGGEDVVAGTVTHCQHVGGAFHQVGVKFAAKIYPKLYLDPSNWTDLGDGAPVEPEKIAGTVLHVDAQEIDRLLLKHNLAATKIDLLSVATADEAVKMVQSRSVDCVLCDISVGDATAETILTSMKQAGFAGTFAVLTAETTPTVLKAATAAGAAAVLGKPYDVQKLMSALGGWLAAGASQGEALYSTLPASPATKPLVEQYVQRVRVLVRDLRTAVSGGDVKSVRGVCQTLRGTGAGFGFALLSQIAKDAVDTLDQTLSVDEAQVHLQRLEQTCRRLSVAP